MTTTARGGSATLDAFYRDGSGTLTDAVTNPLVSIRDPTGTVVVTDAVPTHIGTGHWQYVYAVALDALLGAWEADWTGTINGADLADQDGFTVVAAGSISNAPEGPGAGGPCSAWLTPDDVLSDPRAVLQDGTSLNDLLVIRMIDVGCSLLYKLSGRQFAGVCTDMVRPCARYYKAGGPPAPAWWSWNNSWGTYSSLNPHRAAGSPTLSEITLGAYPLRDILEVRIDGALIPADEYQIHDRRWLVRDPAKGSWPTVQNLFADPYTDDNTFGVWFEWGAVPDVAGLEAAKTYIIELAKGASGDPCNLPERTLSMVMGPGQSIQLVDPMSFLKDGRTGIYLVDEWLTSVNPFGLARRSSVMDPDRARPVRRTQTVPGS